MKVRVFADEKSAQEHAASLPPEAVFVERTEGENPNPGMAAARAAARGVLTEVPVKVVPLKDGTFAVPVPLSVASTQATAADGSKYSETRKAEGADVLAVEKDRLTDVAAAGEESTP